VDCAVGLRSACHILCNRRSYISYDMRLTLWCGKVDDVAVLLEHVDLLNGLDGLDVQLLQGLLELLVIAGRAGGSPLDLSPWGALATISTLDHIIQPERNLLVIESAVARGSSSSKVCLMVMVPCTYPGGNFRLDSTSQVQGSALRN
jgi:hypothetical protein